LYSDIKYSIKAIMTNYFLTIVGFSIHKAYYISEQKTKRVDVYSSFVRECLQIYCGNEIIQKSSFLKRIHLMIYNYVANFSKFIL